MSSPLPITLVLVAYDKADVVGPAIESAAKGSVPPDLIVISDDGSGDGTPDIAETAARRAGVPCRIVRHPRLGVYRIQAMRNTCAANALEGSVVYLSDSDCVFGPLALETHLEIHRRNECALGTGPRFEFLSGQAGPFTSTGTTLEAAHYPDGTYCTPVGANVSFRKALWRELGGFDRAFDGSYGFEEYEFSARALRAGARCVSDPGAWVIHCPHPTVFGHRVPARNQREFDRKYGIDHERHEGAFVHDRVVPWYWSGRRKAPLLGTRVELDAEWGAPPGFVPPPHLQLSRTLRPLIAAAERALGGDRAALASLKELVHSTIDGRTLADGSPGMIYFRELQWVTEHFAERKELRQRLQHWLEGARGVEAALGNGGIEP